jgi:hypothetical protein
LDDVVERLKNTDVTANPIHVYVSGDAGKIIYTWKKDLVFERTQ